MVSRSPGFLFLAAWFWAACVDPTAQASGEEPLKLVFSCSAENDLYCVMTAAGTSCPRHEEALEAVEAAPPGSGVLILADGYPEETTQVEPEVFEVARRKKVRLYVEYPSSLPDLTIGRAHRARLERAVVASDVFGESLAKLRLVAIHDCHFVEAKVTRAHLVAAKVAGFDTAIYGIEDVETHPLLFEHPRREILVSTTKLSQFVTGRYATKDAMQAIWKMVLSWLQPGAELPRLDWTPTVRPTYGPDESLPPDAARAAILRGIDWHTNARMLLHSSWKDEYSRRRQDGRINPTDPVGPAPDLRWPAGDGEHGVLEGFSSRIHYDGRQPARWWLRSDSNGESSLAFALRSEIDGDERSRRIAANLLDWVYIRSGLFQNDPARANFGLVHWAFDSTSLYGDNDVKIILGGIGTASTLGTDRWDEFFLKNILANFRTTGVYGFRGAALRDEELVRRGWEHYWRARTIHYAPHYQAWIWATYLWLYHKTGYSPLLERTRRSIDLMMKAYPERWTWTNGIQQERGRMLLTLAWLIRVDDRPLHRAWLKRLADDMLKCQDRSGAIREELGREGHGSLRPPRSNAEYGTREASLIQENGDPVADLLYTSNFAFLGLHEAVAATGERQYRQMEDRLADFLVRIQVRSEDHPELDGGWFRAFDFRRWEYWGSNADSGWGAWSIEVGWTQAWIPTVLALRELDRNLWDMTAGSRIAERWPEIRELMLPESAMEQRESTQAKHAALGRPVQLVHEPDPRYPGSGAASLTDGYLGPEDHTAIEWLGYHGEDFEATVDLGTPTAIREVGVRFLQSVKVGIYLPTQVEIAVSDDGQVFRTVQSVRPPVSPRRPGPLTATLRASDLEVRARHVRVRAANLGVIPTWHSARGLKAWLFVDEILVFLSE